MAHPKYAVIKFPNKNKCVKVVHSEAKYICAIPNAQIPNAQLLQSPLFQREESECQYLTCQGDTELYYC